MTEKVPVLSVGDKLENGGIVLAAKERFGGKGESWAVGVVLCLLPRDDTFYFATWKYGAELNPHGGHSIINTYWGNYHPTIESAIEDYKDRIHEY